MTHERLARFRKLFELERENLVQSHGRLAAEFQMAPEDLKDETDFTTSSLEQSMRIRLRNREALYLKKIEEALSRIQDGSFGACEGCHEPIEAKRLEARPTTTLCLDCKEAEERNEHTHGTGRVTKTAGIWVRTA